MYFHQNLDLEKNLKNIVCGATITAFVHLQRQGLANGVVSL